LKIMKRPKTWRKIPKEQWEELRRLLLSRGGIQDKEVRGIKEVWRIRIHRTVFTMYENGTLFSTPPSNETIEEIHWEISELLGLDVEKPSKRFLIGLDETGKGEVLGHSVLVGAIVSSNLLKTVDQLIGPADTKRKRSTSYWNGLFLELDRLRGRDMDFVVEKIPPWHIDRYNLNKIMDIVYQRILSQLTREVPVEECRIVLDDYGMGANLSRYLEFLHKQGAEVRVESRADERYVEVKLAAIIAKREREMVMQAINKAFSLPGCPVGSGNAEDPQTIRWLREWKKTGKEWPWFVKTSFKTVREIDGIKGRVRKEDPPIRHEILSRSSRVLFREGKLSVETLSILCPYCGAMLKSCKITPAQDKRLVGRCVNCREIIANLNTTLLYYCGYIVPDTSVILSGIISKDLSSGRFFEGFTFLMTPVVRRESDTKRGRKELGRLARFSSMGRINLRDALLSTENLSPDEAIVEAARKYNAIIYTRDKGMYEMAISKGLFCLTK